jgi:hypothetical protein
MEQARDLTLRVSVIKGKVKSSFLLSEHQTSGIPWKTVKKHLSSFSLTTPIKERKYQL